MAIATLEAAINASPSAALVEPLIFNITTLYELRLGTSAAMEKKIGLLVKVRLLGRPGDRSLPLTNCGKPPITRLSYRSHNGKATAFACVSSAVS